ncbi:MAG: hypothetical protein QOJ59_1680 [Thermomicrobiales bacterium]|nr:hypothetical protein [Thermomicrobiales bacterium]
MFSGFPCLRRPGVVSVLLACCLLITPMVLAVRQAPSAKAQSLGGGSYRVMASVFGIPDDDLVGEETSSGHVLAPYDRLVALPACTESSCPWVPAGTGTEGQWGPQTACAEDNGLCWVEVTSLDTDACTVAPVLDRGPLFVEDNWWAAPENRSYRMERGLPAAEAVRDGKDVGFGPGFSDRGYDVQNVFDYAAAIDLAAGTWSDIGLDPDQGIGEVEVRLLWQSDTHHTDACGEYGNARTNDWVNLRAGPSTDDDVLTVLDTGDRLGIIGGQRDGFYPVVHDGLTGWVFDDYVKPDGSSRSGAAVGVVTEHLNLRSGPSTADDVELQMPAGSLVVLTGEEENGFLSVDYQGTEGWAFADYLDTGEGFGEGGGGDGGSARDAAKTTDSVNLRAGPSLGDQIFLVVPDGAGVLLTGQEKNGFFSVDYQGTKGWLKGDYLSTVRTVAEDLNLRAGASTDEEIFLVMPAGGKVAVLGSEKNGFVPVRYRGREGWAYSSYLA